MTTRLRNGVHDVAEDILGNIPGVEVSDGLFAVTVLVRKEPMITLSVVQGLYLVKTKRTLEARPPQGTSITYVSDTRERDWHGFQTERLNDVRRSLHLAEPRIAHLANLEHELEDLLDGRLEVLDVGPTNPEYWVALGRWASTTGAIQSSRNTAKFAAIYAKQLKEGRLISERFAAWAVRTVARAENLGFRPTRRIGTTSSARGRARASAPSAVTKSPNPPPGLVAGLEEVAKRVRRVTITEAMALAAEKPYLVPSDDVRRVLSPNEICHIRTTIREAASRSLGASLIPMDSWIDAAFDAAFALEAGDRIGSDARGVLLHAWLMIST